MDKFTDFEKKIFFEFLKDLSDHMSNAGCNDFEVLNTPEGRSLFSAAVRHGFSSEDANEILVAAFEESDTTIATCDFIIFEYLVNKLQEYLKVGV